MMLGYTSKKVLSLFTSPHFKSANAVYNILGAAAINDVIAQVFGQKIGQTKSGQDAGGDSQKKAD
jgi:hypothetical protein